MSTDDTNTRNEACRFCVLHYLAQIPKLAQDAVTIHRFLSRQHDWTVEEVADACLFLCDPLAADSPAYAEAVRSPLGGTKAYRITSAGRRAVEWGL